MRALGGEKKFNLFFRPSFFFVDRVVAAAFAVFFFFPSCTAAVLRVNFCVCLCVCAREKRDEKALSFGHYERMLLAFCCKGMRKLCVASARKENEA